MAVNINQVYTPQYGQQPFKYNGALLVSKLIFTSSPEVLDDAFQFANYYETQSYCKALNKFKPLARIQVFIDARNRQRGVLSPEQDRKRRTVVRDWFRLVLWYVRIRKAYKTGKIHSSLLEIESRATLKPSVLADPKKYLMIKTNELYEKNPDESNVTESSDSSASSHEIKKEIKDEIKRAMRRSSRTKQDFFTGCKF